MLSKWLSSSMIPLQKFRYINQRSHWFAPLGVPHPLKGVGRRVGNFFSRSVFQDHAMYEKWVRSDTSSNYSYIYVYVQFLCKYVNFECDEWPKDIVRLSLSSYYRVVTFPHYYDMIQKLLCFSAHSRGSVEVQ